MFKLIESTQRVSEINFIMFAHSLMIGKRKMLSLWEQVS